MREAHVGGSSRGLGHIARREPRVLFICGSHNQTTQMIAVANAMGPVTKNFTPYYGGAVLETAQRMGLVERTIAGSKFREQCLREIEEAGLSADPRGERGAYDLVVTCSDLVVPPNVRHCPGVLVQEGMMDPENWFFPLVKAVPVLPRWFASTAATGQSHWYRRFCVASHGYRDFFVAKGIPPGKLVVTGIPNFDDCQRFRNNSFPHRGYVLVCTSDARETMKRLDRQRLIKQAVRAAAGRKLIFKLHPNENVSRARREILQMAPDARIYTSGCAEEMIANCDVLMTEYSSTAFVGLALGVEVHSLFDGEELRRLLPWQNGGRSASLIADVCWDVLGLARRPSFGSSNRSNGAVQASSGELFCSAF